MASIPMISRASGFGGLVALALLGPPVGEAHAGDPSLAVGALAGYSCFADSSRYHGAAFGADAAYTFNTFWGLRAAYQRGSHDSKDVAFQTDAMSLGVRYQLDVLAVVPWVEIGPSLLLTDDDEGPEATSWAVTSSFGLDWLMPSGAFAGALVRYHQIVGNERFPALMDLQFRAGVRWDFGDPFD